MQRLMDGPTDSKQAEMQSNSKHHTDSNWTQAKPPGQQNMDRQQIRWKDIG